MARLANPALKWSEVGPVATDSAAAATKPAFRKVPLAYCLVVLRTHEPEPGKFRWEIVDLAPGKMRCAWANSRDGRLMRLTPPRSSPCLVPPPPPRRAPRRPPGHPNLRNKVEKSWHPDFSDPLYSEILEATLVAEAQTI